MQTTRSTRLSFAFWIAILGVFFVYLVTRLYHLLALPPFIDESIHIRWASDVYQGHFLSGAGDGRLLALWWMSLFQLSGNASLWLTRYATILFCMINVAVLFNLGTYLGKTYLAGILAAVFYILSPYAVFYERISMPDSYVAPWALLAVWFCFRYIRRGRSL